MSERVITIEAEGLPSDWQTAPFERCVLERGIEGKASIQQGDYRPIGRFPIVDQGSNSIAGYTDNENLVHREDLPVILFGDHTRVLKFLDFPFATGADGTKLFRANEELVEPKFLYYALLHLDIPSRGYNRHFKYLKEKTIAVPDRRDEQRAIAAVLSKIQEAVDVQGKIVATLKELKAATMAKLFRDGLRGEPLKQTEIGEIPKSWETTPLGNIAQVSTGTTPSTADADYYVGDTPFVKTAEIDNNIIIRSQNYISQRAVQDYNLRIYPAGSIFLAMYGQGKTRGRAALLGIPAATTQNTAAIEPSPALNGEFLWHYLLSQYEALRGMGNLGHLSHLNLGYVKELLIPVPSVKEQIQIKTVLSHLQNRAEIAIKRHQELNQLFSSMLQLLMTGQVRVTEAMPLIS
jgi:type I restriction enzyme, S subunit